jgi:RNA polymerase sigma-70 factor (ECF subfamily)
VTTAHERFGALFDANYGPVFAYSVRRCSSRQDAEDVVAETFAVAWRRLGDIPDGEAARLWLIRTARLVRYNLERTRRRQRSLAVRVGEASAVRSITTGDDADSGFVAQALDSLSVMDREVLLLHAWDDLTADQIGVVLGITTQAVWKRMQRARERLSRTLRRLGEEDPPPRAPVSRTTRREAP